MVIFRSDESSHVHAQPAEEWVFHSLDHQRVDDGANGWLISVVGVHVDGGAIWVQVAKDGRDDETIIVQMDRKTNPADVLASLKNARSAGSRFVVIPAPKRGH